MRIWPGSSPWSLLVRTADADALPCQRQALADAGCGQIVEDGVGAPGQPELLELLGRLQAGDVVVLYSAYTG